MRFLLLLHGDEAAEAALSFDERRAIMTGHGAFAIRLREAGRLVLGEPLQASAGAVVVRRDGVTGVASVTDGPFAETKEQVGGVYLLECADRDEAVRWALEVPASPGLAVEVRPLATT